MKRRGGQRHEALTIFSDADDLDTSNKSMLHTELELWHIKCTNCEKTVTSAIEAIQECSEDMFPKINKLLFILVVLQMSTASSDSSFSTFMRLT